MSQATGLTTQINLAVNSVLHLVQMIGVICGVMASP